MPQASITINGSVLPALTLPLDVVVALANQDIGGEVSYAWTMLDKPPGSAATLATPTTSASGFTPDVEGSYLIQLVVNAGLPTQHTATALGACVQVKNPDLRVPAAGETTQASTADGWAVAVDVFLRKIDALLSDSSTRVCAIKSAGRSAGQIMRFVGETTLKAGLPGVEVIAGCDLADATQEACQIETLALLEAGVDGDTTPTNGSSVRVRTAGLVRGLTGTPIVGDPVYLSNAGDPALAPGTYFRIIGSVVSVSGGTYSFFFDGSKGCDGPLVSRSPNPTTGTVTVAARVSPKRAAPGGNDDGFVLFEIDNGSGTLIELAVLDGGGLHFPSGAGGVDGLATGGHTGSGGLDSAATVQYVDELHPLVPAAKTANYVATAEDRIILVDATAGPLSVTLPSALSYGFQPPLTVKKVDVSANVVTVQAAAGQYLERVLNGTWPLGSADAAVTVFPYTTAFGSIGRWAVYSEAFRTEYNAAVAALAVALSTEITDRGNAITAEASSRVTGDTASVTTAAADATTKAAAAQAAAIAAAATDATTKANAAQTAAATDATSKVTAAARAMIPFGAASIPTTTSTTFYLTPGYSTSAADTTQKRFVAPCDGTIIAMYVLFATAPTSSSGPACFVQLAKNGSTEASADTVFTSGVATGNKTGLAIAVVAGDYLDARITTSSTLTSGGSGVSVTVLFRPTV
jgi:hypothetical protein